MIGKVTGGCIKMIGLKPPPPSEKKGWGTIQSRGIEDE